MKNIIPRKILFRKALSMALIFVILGFGLFVYDYNQYFIRSFKPYYVKAYTASIFYEKERDTSLSGEFKQNSAASIPVLTYHGIIGKPDGANVLLENFKNQMIALKKAGWQTISIVDYADFVSGKKQLPAKSFLLTFDDGRKDSYYPVDPILRALNYRAVMYVIVARSERDSNFSLSWRELDKMFKSGRWDIQSHGFDDHDLYRIENGGEKKYHFLSNRLYLDEESRIETEEEYFNRISLDLAKSKNILEGRYGKEVFSFAYPFSDLGQNTFNEPNAKQLIEQAVRREYKISFQQVNNNGIPFMNKPLDDNFFGKRFTVGPNLTGEELVRLLENASK